MKKKETKKKLLRHSPHEHTHSHTRNYTKERGSSFSSSSTSARGQRGGRWKLMVFLTKKKGGEGAE